MFSTFTALMTDILEKVTLECNNWTAFSTSAIPA
jgi:hypothetical protein